MESKPAYRKLESISDAEALQALQTADPSLIAPALLRLALHSKDAPLIENLCLDYLNSRDSELRRISALSLGHLARLHGPEFDFDAAFLPLTARLDDSHPEVRGTAWEALTDMQVFRWGNAGYVREEIISALETGSKVDMFCAIFHLARYEADVNLTFRWCGVLARDENVSVRIAAIWAIAGIWDRLDAVKKGEAGVFARLMLQDVHAWSREMATEVITIVSESSPELFTR